MNTERYAFESVRARTAVLRPQNLTPVRGMARRLDHRTLRGRPALYSVTGSSSTDDDATAEMLLSKSGYDLKDNAFACDVDDAMVSMLVANTMGGAAFSI